MRVLFGLILGIALTVGGAYVYDAHNALAADRDQSTAEQPLVNWPVVREKWNALTSRAQVELEQLTDRLRENWNRHVG